MVQVAPSGFAVTVYESTAPPEDGGETETLAEETPSTAVGAPGEPGGMRPPPIPMMPVAAMEAIVVVMNPRRIKRLANSRVLINFEVTLDAPM
ncbi:hypothetical protein GCM10023346_43320 [Arthrobacter gyeryongensis]|uniref:Uncharacterized protein n=1 Tax=Arthrobacter gyeryongensis TaxID=1650592 RepID=A0ABP9STC3_9MICC